MRRLWVWLFLVMVWCLGFSSGRAAAGWLKHTATVTLKRDHKVGDKVNCSSWTKGSWLDDKHLNCTED